jgi:predicted  nucleic acid-binding Zn ribbon protein
VSANTKLCPKCAGTGRLLEEAVSKFFEYYRCTSCDHVWMVYKDLREETPSQVTSDPPKVDK